MGARYVEVFPSSAEEVKSKILPPAASSTWVRMRGLPFTASKTEIQAFFQGIPVHLDNIHFVVKSGGRPSGEAFVQFSDDSEAQRALQYDKATLGARYIELFPSSQEECETCMARAVADDRVPRGPVGYQYGDSYGNASYGAPYGIPQRPAYSPYPSRTQYPMGGGMGEPVVRCRGLPFEASIQDIGNFFSGLPIADVRMKRASRLGKLSGEAFVTFKHSRYLGPALNNSMQPMQSRYIEVFPSSFAERDQFSA
jgi:heterogeneous nuclear ribonucleoprotein F/H